MEKKHVPFTEVEQKFIHKVVEERHKAESKFPLLFGLAATFGLVATLYGFEKLIDRNQFMVNNPWILIVVGVVILVSTGAAYRKLN